MTRKIRGKRVREIHEIIKKKPTSLREIEALTNFNYNTIRSAVRNLTEAGLIERVGKGKYRSK